MKTRAKRQESRQSGGSPYLGELVKDSFTCAIYLLITHTHKLYNVGLILIPMSPVRRMGQRVNRMVCIWCWQVLDLWFEPCSIWLQSFHSTTTSLVLMGLQGSLNPPDTQQWDNWAERKQVIFFMSYSEVTTKSKLEQRSLCFLSQCQWLS